MPDLRPLALLGFAAAFVSADGFLKKGGALDGRVPQVLRLCLSLSCN